MDSALHSPSPQIASYSDWSRASPFPIQPRFNPLPNFVPPRTYRSSKASPFTHEVRRPPDRFSLSEVLVMNTNQRPATAQPKAKRAKLCEAENVAKKAVLVTEGRGKSRVEGGGKGWTRPMTPRGQWLYQHLKPEDHFTGERHIQKVPLSPQSKAVRMYLQEAKEPKPAIAPVSEYVSTDGKEVIATINAALSEPPKPPEAPSLSLPAKPADEPPAQTPPESPSQHIDEPPALPLEARIKALEAQVASLHSALGKKTEYQAEFTQANTLVGRTETFKPTTARVSYFL